MCELLVEKEFNENYFNYAFLLQFGGKLGISFFFAFGMRLGHFSGRGAVATVT